MSFTGGTNGASSFYSKQSSNGNDIGEKESIWDRSNLLTKYTLCFITRFFRKGDELGLDDIGPPPRANYSKTIGPRLLANYNKQLIGGKGEPSFSKALLITFGPQLLLVASLDLLGKCVFLPMQSVCLGWIIRDSSSYLTTIHAPPLPPSDGQNVNITTTTTTTTLAPDVADAPLPLDVVYKQIIYDALLLVMFLFLGSISSHPLFFQASNIGSKCRAASSHMIYKKALRLNQAALAQTNVGQVVVFMANDLNRFDQLPTMLPFIITAPAQATTVIVILSNFYLGLYPTLASLATIVVFVLVQAVMGRGFSKARAKTAPRTDERVRLMNEIILAMRIIKMYAWEEPFKKLVYAARKREVTRIAVTYVLKVINMTLFFVASKIIVFVALVTFVLRNEQLTPEILFVTIGLANHVRVSLCLFLPNAISQLAETLISCRRINTFLMLPELDSASITGSSSTGFYRSSSDAYGRKHVLTMNQVYCAWSAPANQDNATGASGADLQSAVVRNLTLSVGPRDLVLVVGRVGSGKSSVLMSILGELPVASGRLEVHGRIAYASQEAWIFSGTVRDNILFGKSMAASRYNEVIRVCSLERDLEVLAEGDRTIVGERGVSLSGGQKARVNLARALYAEADLYVLDDPLSAVDAPVARHIFNESLRTFLRKKAVILATHQLQFLRHASKVLVVDRDHPAAFGTVQEVVESEAFALVGYGKDAFEDATTAIGKEPTDDPDARGPDGDHKRAASSEKEINDGGSRRSSSLARSNLSASGESGLLLDGKSVASLQRAPSIDDAPAEQKALKKLRKAGDGAGHQSSKRSGREAVKQVSANCTTYRYYLTNAAGIIMLCWFVLTNFAAQGAYQYTDYFLSTWTDSVQRKESLGALFSPQSFVDNFTTGQITTVYAALVACCFVVCLLRAITYHLCTLRASINLHHKLFNSIVHAPMTFFDFSPIGIMLNRLSMDMGLVDEMLPAIGSEIMMILVNMAGVLVLSIIIDAKNFLVSLALVLAACSLVKISARTITRLKQIEGITRSPIYSHISTTLQGLHTIRAFRAQDEFQRLFFQHQDRNSAAWFTYLCAGRWLTIWTDWLCVSFVATVVTFRLAFSFDATNASLIGLLISQVLVVVGPFQWGMRQLVEFGSQMTSVERIREFSKLEPEEAAVSAPPGGSEPEMPLVGSARATGGSAAGGDEFKPTRGEISFANVTLSYFSDEPPVLRCLNFNIGPGEKVGVVGRTGAGKSSIVAVLFRLYKFEGRILIDGRDTKKLPLSQLRKCISIIPQDPILFGGSLRKNLDPFGDHSDERLWSALEAVQLKPLFARNPSGLDHTISEGGANFSVGQRQLICLARAIVRRNQILVMDEATANVDPDTDAFIQDTIQSQFEHCTVITIAHRLVTIIKSDKVLVLDRGEVKEFGEPYELMQSDGLFAQMVKSSTQRLPSLIKKK